jgi:hypothetical protein
VNESAIPDNPSLKEYRYKMVMFKMTADILYYNSFQFTPVLVNGPQAEPVNEILINTGGDWPCLFSQGKMAEPLLVNIISVFRAGLH